MGKAWERPLAGSRRKWGARVKQLDPISRDRAAGKASLFEKRKTQFERKNMLTAEKGIKTQQQRRKKKGILSAQ